jgi:hypothetical protein
LLGGKQGNTTNEAPMTFPMELNRRHKVALFLTLVDAGVNLVLGGSTKQTAGVALLGVAFAWAFGSNSRIVHWLFVVLGSALLVAPIGFDWSTDRHTIKFYESQVAAFERRIPELAKQHPHKKTATDPQTGVRMGWNGATWIVISPGASTHSIGDEWDGEHWIPKNDTPKWLSDALQAGLDVKALPSYEKPDYFSPEHFSLTRALVADWRVALPGLLLLCVGLGLLIGVRPTWHPTRKGYLR